ncbi:MAG: WecB/TagA/CpsF family glycosyltransferase [Hyphomicrobiales bacterium]|nr:WecB/TagA/CpsF family glycosyltransferase [Hyphomicrobiales bacterium]
MRTEAETLLKPNRDDSAKVTIGLTFGEENLQDRRKDAQAAANDLDRNVYCVLGLPLDAYDMDGALKSATSAAHDKSRCLLSTPNLNFLVGSLGNKKFRESVLISDMSVADGMPLIWIAKLLGLPLKERVAGSELFEKMVEQHEVERPIKIFFFGGDDGVAEKASTEINANSKSVECVGTLNPGFGTIEEMSSDAIIDQINDSEADFLVVALGAQKGQEWLRRNHDKLRIPLRSHLGACMNFQAGTVSRAPLFFQKYGLEWLWRIKEEPQLWRRYWSDGLALLRLTLARILPLAIKRHIADRLTANRPKPFEIAIRDGVAARTLVVKGHAIERNVEHAIQQFKSAFSGSCWTLSVDLSDTTEIDQRFLGLLIMARKVAIQSGVSFHIKAGSAALRRAFELNEADYLLSDEIPHADATSGGRTLPIPGAAAAGDA